MKTICKLCGKEYNSKPFLIKNGKSKYCSKLCYYEDRKSSYLDRFFKKIEKTKSCWIWKGGLDKDGYGQFNFKENNINNHVRSHRFSYFLHKGEIPINMNILHKCDNPKCVNPDHLFIGTTQDNVNDRQRKGRSYNGDNLLKIIKRGEENNMSKLKEKDIIEIRKLSATLKQNKIAKMFNVERHTIHKITSYKTWKHVV